MNLNETKENAGQKAQAIAVQIKALLEAGVNVRDLDPELLKKGYAAARVATATIKAQAWDAVKAVENPSELAPTPQMLITLNRAVKSAKAVASFEKRVAIAAL